eukprot:906123-Pyramimonas_sp.AAC.1
MEKRSRNSSADIWVLWCRTSMMGCGEVGAPLRRRSSRARAVLILSRRNWGGMVHAWPCRGWALGDDEKPRGARAKMERAIRVYGTRFTTVAIIMLRDGVG